MNKETCIRAILEVFFNGFRDELIDIALHNIMQIECDDSFFNMEVTLNTICEEIIKIPEPPYPEANSAYKYCKADILEIIDKYKSEGNKVIRQDADKVLDKIRAELHATAEMHEDGDYYLREEWIDEIIDEYMSERGDKK